MREMKAYGRYFYPLQPLIKNKVYFLFCSATHMYVWTGSKQTQILIFWKSIGSEQKCRVILQRFKIILI